MQFNDLGVLIRQNALHINVGEIIINTVLIYLILQIHDFCLQLKCYFRLLCILFVLMLRVKCRLPCTTERRALTIYGKY